MLKGKLIDSPISPKTDFRSQDEAEDMWNSPNPDDRRSEEYGDLCQSCRLDAGCKG